MEKLLQIVQLVASKYMDRVNLILTKDGLTLEYLYYMQNGEKDIYKSMEITEIEGKITVYIFGDSLEGTIDNISDIEDIIKILDKQSKVTEFNKAQIKYIKEKYPVGAKIELIKMYDFQAPPTGSKGTVFFVDDLGTIHTQWENGSTLGLIVGKDEFKILD